MPDLPWRRAPCSQDSCAEVAHMPDDKHVLLRFHDDPTRPAVMVFTRAEWEAFTAGIRAGEFDPPEATP